LIAEQASVKSGAEQAGTRPARPAVRLGWLDALRGIAALLVAFHHFGLPNLVPYGKQFEDHFDLGIYAVMLFFLVSGYIVPASLERRGDVRGFWVGRIFRIYPVVMVVVALSLLILPHKYSAVPQVVTDHPVKSALANLLLLHEMLNIPSALGVMWTLCYEMVFYFFVTALFTLGHHRKSAPIALGFAGAALLLGAFVTPAMITHDRGTTRNLILATAVVMGFAMFCVLSGRLSLVRTGALTLGALGSVLVLFNARSTFFETMMIFATMFAGTVIFRMERGQVDRQLGRLTCGFVLVCGFLVGYMYNHGDAIYRTWTQGWMGFSLPYAAAWATFGLGMLLRNRRFPRVLTWLGSISYSLYLIHIPVIWGMWWLIKDGTFPKHGAGKFIPAAIFLAVTLLLSYLSYRLIELPGQNLGRKVLKAMNARTERQQATEPQADGGEPAVPAAAPAP
jgi:peptidoglycan/LPS O-acetylase OafA/YrhL